MTQDMRNGSAMYSLLYRTILRAETEEDMRILLDDLCTYKEVEQMAQRAYAAKMLKEGRTYAEIIAATDISSATLSRVSRCLQYGRGAYEKFIPED
jgi:TrpR-related protein YerC/YecD